MSFNKTNNVASAIQNYNSIASDGRPNSLVDCSLNLSNPCPMQEDRFLQYLKKRKELGEADDQLLDSLVEWETPAHLQPPTKRVRAPRKVKAIRPYHVDDHGVVHFLKPKETFWYLFYVKNPTAVLSVPKYIQKFRRRFRMPHPEFINLLNELKQSGEFRRWQGKDATGCESSPISLLLLGALRYLGRGLTFDDLEESTSIGEETHRQFFHAFIKYGSNTLYPKHVIAPTTAAEFEYHTVEFEKGGLPGCGFSTDGTHVLMWSCAHNMRQAHIGFKMSHPARAFNVSTNHRGYILHSTDGSPSRWNDKSLAHVDDFISGIHRGRRLQDVKFKLLCWEGRPGRSAVTTKKYRGAWGLTDNGYHYWTCTQAPAKLNSLVTEQRLSDWIESFRKDSECVFGILKGRWRILKTGVRLHSIEAVDNVWKTCCALHNRLLEVDGLSEPWEGELGQNDVASMRESAPFALRRLGESQLREFGSRQHELESRNTATVSEPMIPPEELDEDNQPNTPPVVDDEGYTFVNSLPYKEFRKALVVHFDIKWRRHEVKWVRRKKQNSSTLNNN